MKVITLKQPWATLIAEGYKKYEFRSWKTNYRGKILIHAGCGIDKAAMEKFKDLNLSYPKSKILAEVNIVDCIKLNKEINEKIIEENEFIYGNNYDRCGYAWKINDVKKLNVDKKVKGRLGIWDIDI